MAFMFYDFAAMNYAHCRRQRSQQRSQQRRETCQTMVTVKSFKMNDGNIFDFFSNSVYIFVMIQ